MQYLGLCSVTCAVVSVQLWRRHNGRGRPGCGGGRSWMPLLGGGVDKIGCVWGVAEDLQPLLGRREQVLGPISDAWTLGSAALVVRLFGRALFCMGCPLVTYP